MRYPASACAAKAGVDQLTRILALQWDGGGAVESVKPMIESAGRMAAESLA